MMLHKISEFFMPVQRLSQQSLKIRTIAVFKIFVKHKIFK
jgi:hypothetical protein